jgi:PD-(D/E)XK nuclease superfamily protein
MSEKIPEGYVRVTDLLAPYNGLQGIDPIVLEKAADRGKRVHAYCELYAQSLLIGDIDDDCKGYVDSFSDWFDSIVAEVLSFEERIFDQEHRLTGQYDLIVKFKGSDSKILIDIKTPAQSNPTWALQTAAYMWMLNRKGPERLVDRRGCLMIDRNGKFATFKEYGTSPSDDIRDRSVFIGILEAYRYFFDRRIFRS